MTSGGMGDADIFATRRWRDRRDRGAGEAAADATATGTSGKPDGQPASVRHVDGALALGSADRGSIEWLRAAAEGGSSEAMVRLGLELVDQDGPFGEAERWLRRAAEAGDPQGQLHYGRLLLFSDRAEEAERWLDAAIAAAPALAATLISDLHLRGADELAARWEQKAAEAGDPEAALDLAIEAIKRGDHDAAKRWAEWARKLGHPKAELALATDAMERGDEEEAWSWLGRAATAGNVHAAATYGLWLVGEGRKEEARPFLEQVAGADIEQAADGNPEVMNEMAEAIMKLGDRPATIRAFEIAGRNGSADAALMVARFMLAADRPADALPWLTRPGITELPDGGLLLGMALAGAGERDQAKQAYAAAASAGDPRAAHKLGVLYEQERDIPRSIAWYERAADGGEASAMFNLGLIFQTSDPALAERWMRRAAEHGHERAQRAVEALDKRARTAGSRQRRGLRRRGR
jgi:TPR repeat protein